MGARLVGKSRGRPAWYLGGMSRAAVALLTAVAAVAPSSARGQDAAAPAVDAAPAQGLDARARKLSDDLAVAIKRIPGDHRDQRFAVMPFAEIGEEAKQRQLGLVVADLVVTNLARDHRVPLVERAALQRIVEEQALGQTGAVDEAQAAQVGKLAGARGMVLGQVADAGDTFLVTARVVDAETAAVLATAEMAVPKAELVAFSAKSLVLRSKSGAMFRSLVLPGWGQAYNDEPVKAVVVGGTTGTLVVATIATLGLASFTGFLVYPRIGLKRDAPAGDFFDATFVPRGDTPAETQRLAVQARDLGNLEFALGAGFAGLAVAAWALGAIDAYASGVDVESLDAALARN